MRDSLGDGRFANDRDRATAFADWVSERIGGKVSADHTDLYGTASGFFDSWWGLARYWRKREAA